MPFRIYDAKVEDLRKLKYTFQHHVYFRLKGRLQLYVHYLENSDLTTCIESMRVEWNFETEEPCI